MAQTTLEYLIKMRTATAQRDLGGLSQGAKKAGEELEKAEKAADKLGNTSQKSGKKIRGMSGDLKKASGQIGALHRGAGKSARSVSVLVGGIGGLAAAGGPAGIAVAGLVAGFLAGGVAAYGLAKGVSYIVKNARELTEELAPLEGVNDLFQPISPAALQSFESAVSALSGLPLIAKQIGLSFAEKFAPEIEAGAVLILGLGLAVADFVKLAINKLNTFLDALEEMGPLVEFATGLATGGLSSMALALRRMSKDMENGTLIQGGYLDQAQKMIGTLDRIATSSKGASSEITDQADATQRLTKAQSDLEAAKSAQAAKDKARTEGRSAAQSNLAAIGVGAASTDPAIVAMNQQMRLSNDLLRGLITTSEYDSGVSLIRGGLKSVEDQEREAARAVVSSRIQGAGAALSSVAAGDVAGLLSMAGPAGMAAGAVVGGLTALGENGADGVADNLEGFKDTLIAGIGELPELIATVIPGFIEGLVRELPIAILKIIPALAKAIAQAINPLNKAKDVLNRLEDSKNPMISKVATSIKGVGDSIEGLFKGSRDSGGPISRVGLYRLHPGEEIIRNNGQSRQGSRAWGKAPSVSIQLRTPALFPFLNEIERVTGYGGLREAY